jgi:hypothetical protein
VHKKFEEDQLRHLRNITVITKSLGDCNVGITDGIRFVKYVVETDSGAMIYTPSFVKIVSAEN